MFRTISMSKNILGLTVLNMGGCAALHTTTGQAVMDYVLQTVALIATPVVLLFVKRAIDIFDEKTGIAASEQLRVLLNSAVANGITYAEEQAHKALKTTEGAEVLLPDGASKRDMAVTFVLDTLKEHNVAGYSRDFLTQLVEAKLNMMRPVKDK